jgi:hypothetical protein
MLDLSGSVRLQLRYEHVRFLDRRGSALVAGGVRAIALNCNLDSDEAMTGLIRTSAMLSC